MLINPITLERETKRIALHLKLCNHLDYNVKVNYDPEVDLTDLVAKNEEGKSIRISFTTKELLRSLDDLNPKIEAALKQLYSRDLSFIMNDET